MGSHDVTVSWDNFNLPADEDLSILFSSHLGPTDLFKLHMSEPRMSSTIHPFSDDPTESGAMRLMSRDLAVQSLDSATGNNRNLMQATTDVFEAVLKGESHLPDNTTKRITRHALALAKTSPEVFRPNFKLNQLARRAEFSLPAKSGEGHEHERYDIVQWIASFKLLGKAFDLEGWEPVIAKYIVPERDSNSVVIQVSLGGQQTLDVTQGAKEAMDTALTYMSSTPPPFFNCKQAVVAVTEILGKELLEYTMPQSREELEAFNWDDVKSGDKSTYPEAPQPDDADFAVVKAVHTLSKDAKDKAAQALGMPHAGVPSYITYLQKWKKFRDILAVYRTMYPKESIQTSYDRAVISLRYCRAEAAMLVALDQDINKFLADRKRAKKKEQLARDMTAKEAEAKEAENKAKQLAAEKKQQEKEKHDAALQEIAAQGVRVTRTSTRARQMEITEEMKRREAEILETEQRIQEATDEATQKRRERQRLREEKQKMEEEEANRRKKKRSKRNDVTRLDMNPSPRKRANLRPDWDPPMLDRPGVYSAPGAIWKDSNIAKLQLLSALRAQLTVHCLLDKPMTMATVMEFLGADGDGTTFQERVFLYLMCLLIAQTRYVHFYSPCCPIIVPVYT